MKNGATRDYHNGPKGNWRRTVHNRIVDGLKSRLIHPRDAVVLYLAGQQDLDRVEFLRRGFNPNNLISVERLVKQVRLAWINELAQARFKPA